MHEPNLKRVFWKDVEADISKIDSVFCELVNELSPDVQYPLYLSLYKYGERIGDNVGTILKHKSGESYRLGSSYTPPQVLSDLGYGTSSSPLMMILDKKFEWYIYDQINQRTFPIYIEGPGFFIGSKQLLSANETKTYISSSIMACTAGTRSAFLLPNIGNQKNHMALQRHFKISGSPPKDMQEHWEIFKEIYTANQTEWYAKVLFFSEKWIKSLKNDPKWIYVHRYLIEKTFKGLEHDRNHFFYNFAFSVAQSKKNILKNPYLNETAKHILGISIGANLGFKPSTNDQALPLHSIQNAYATIYRLKQSPIIFEPASFDITKSNQLPVYYSLQRPIIASLEKQTKTEPRALVNIHYLSRMISKYIDAFSENKESNYFTGTCFQHLAESSKFSYFHHLADNTEDPIRTSKELENEDPRFSYNMEQNDFPADARFFRGVIQISKK